MLVNRTQNVVKKILQFKKIIIARARGVGMVVKVGSTLCVHRRQVMTGNSVGGSRGMSPRKIFLHFRRRFTEF
jgi:hypothetical protein